MPTDLHLTKNKGTYRQGAHNVRPFAWHSRPAFPV